MRHLLPQELVGRARPRLHVHRLPDGHLQGVHRTPRGRRLAVHGARLRRRRVLRRDHEPPGVPEDDGLRSRRRGRRGRDLQARPHQPQQARLLEPRTRVQAVQRDHRHRHAVRRDADERRTRRDGRPHGLRGVRAGDRLRAHQRADPRRTDGGTLGFRRHALRLRQDAYGSSSRGTSSSRARGR